MRRSFGTAAATVLLAIIAAGSTSRAVASMTYNYEQAWMFDSTSGLYWQVLPISTATFVPAYGSIADLQQLEDLARDVGLSGMFVRQQPSAYSLPLANLLSFFESTAAAQPGDVQSDLNVFALYRYPPDQPPGGFQYVYLSYQAADPTGALWLYNGATTVGTYGPGSPCPPIGRNCPDTEPGLVVSSTPPVPVPAAGWLLISGIGTLAALRARRSVERRSIVRIGINPSRS